MRLWEINIRDAQAVQFLGQGIGTAALSVYQKDLFDPVLNRLHVFDQEVLPGVRG